MTMDVTFSETEMYFSSLTSTSSLQGETYSEEMNWMVVLPDVVLTSKKPSIIDFPTQEFSTSTCSAQELSAGKGSISATQYDTTWPLAPQNLARPPSAPIIPTNDSSAANVPEVCIDSEVNTNNLINDHVSIYDGSKYQLPPRSNRGKPPERYSPDNSKTLKYPIAHYVSTEQLPYSIQAFVN